MTEKRDESLLARLDEIASLKIGDAPPAWLPANGWAPEISRLCARAAEEIRLYAVWVDDLQADMYVNCVYCGHRYGPNSTTPVTMADALKAHVAECPQHPMSGLVKALQFYADAANYKQTHIPSKGFSVSETACDDGRIARAALAKVQP